MGSVFRWFVLCAVAALCLGPFLFLVSTSLEGGDVFQLDSVADLLPNEWDTSAYFEVFEKLPDLKYFFLNTAFLCFFGVMLQQIPMCSN